MMDNCNAFEVSRDRQAADRIAPVASLLLAGLMLLGVTGCGGETDPRGDRVGVRGEVLLDGQPLTGAKIVFVSAHDGAVKAISTIQEGHYEIEAEHGPLVGKSRVEIVPEFIELEQLESERGDDKLSVPELTTTAIPAKYNARSELFANVSGEGENEFNFQLTTQSRP